MKEDKSRNFEPEDVALAKGILKSIKKRKFIFMLHFLNGLLGALEPATKILQKRDVGFRHAMPVIQAVFESVQRFRSDESFKSFLKETEETVKKMNEQPEDQDQNQPSTSRVRQRSTRLSNSIVMETLGERNSENENENRVLKSAFFEVTDYVLNEMERRFNNNSKILTAISELNNISADDFDKKTLEPLTDIGLVLPSDAELNVVKQFICNEQKKQKTKKSAFSNYCIR